MFNKVCIPVTDEPVSLHATRAALGWAARLKASTLLINVVTIPPLHKSQNPERVRADLSQRSKHFLETWQAFAQQHEQPLETRTVIQQGRSVAQTIVEVAEQSGCDLIAMGTHGLEGVNRALLGSVAEGVVRQASLPVLLFRKGVVPSIAVHALERVLIAIDGSLGSDLAVQAARELCERTAASAQLLYILPDPFIPLNPSQVHLDNSAFSEALSRDADLLVERAEQNLTGIKRLPSLIEAAAYRRVADVILEVSNRERPVLLVLGTHGRGGMQRLLLGSVAETVAHRAAIPVLLVRGSSQTAPIVREDTPSRETEFTKR